MYVRWLVGSEWAGRNASKDKRRFVSFFMNYICCLLMFLHNFTFVHFYWVAAHCFVCKCFLHLVTVSKEKVLETRKLLTSFSSYTEMPLLYRDPWAKREAWRKHPVFSTASQLRQLFPGFGIAVVAFTAYVVWDNWKLSKKEHSDAHESHH